MADVKKAAGAPVARPVARPVAAPPPRPAAVTTRAPAAAPATGWGPKTTGSARPQGTGFEGPRLTPAQKQATAAKAELEEANLAAPSTISNQFEQRMLISGATQHNPLARLAGNNKVICSAAATVNALILASGSDSARIANAKSLATAATNLGAWSKLPAAVKREDVEQSLKNFEAGSMRPADVWNLQQLAWAQVQAIEPKSSDGAKPGVLGVLVSQLSKDGAQFGDAVFTQVSNGREGHWTVTANQTYANSGPPNASALDPRPEFTSKSPNWDSDVRPPRPGQDTVKVQVRASGEKHTQPPTQANAFEFIPLFVHASGPGALDRMRSNANNALDQGLARGLKPRVE